VPAAKRFDLTHLSSDVLGLLASVREEWLAVGVGTGPADRLEAVAGAAEAYRAAGLELPRLVLWFGSPLAATHAAVRLARVSAIEPPDATPALRRIEIVRATFHRRVRPESTSAAYQRIVSDVCVWLRHRVGSNGDLIADEVNDRVWTTAENVIVSELDNQLRRQGAGDLCDEVTGMRAFAQVTDAFKGQFEADDIALEDLCGRMGLGGTPPAGFPRLARTCGWWWAFRGAVVFSEPPSELHRDEHGRAHRADGPAVCYPDGFAVHAWHGVRVSPRVIAGDLTGTYWLAEPSAKVRGIIAERMGYARLLAEVPARKLHSNGDGTLWRIDEPGSSDYSLSMSFVAPEDIWLLELADADPSRPQSVLRVPPDTRGVPAALAWTRDCRGDYVPPTPSH
jgi:hypothetical protein